MSSDQRPRQSRAVEQRSESGGGSLLGTLLTLIMIPVGWFASVVAAMVVLAHLLAPNESLTLISGVGPEPTLWVAGGVLVVAGFAVLVRPATIFFGWLVMGVLVAVAATFFLGWTTLFVIFEVLTVGFLLPAHFFKLVEDAPDGFLAALALERKLR